MKKTLLVLTLAIGTITSSFGQTKSSGTVTLRSGFTLKIDVNNTTNLVTFTMAGPLNNWLSIGLDDTEMGTGDCLSYSSQLYDQHLVGGHNSPASDTTNNLTMSMVTSDDITKTITFTRPLNTGDTNDYTFDYATLNTLNVIWSEGTSTNQEHISSSYFGYTTLTFAVLGNEDFVSPLEKITVYPNPSNGIFKISKSNEAEVSKIKVFDVNAKLLKEINSDTNTSDMQIDLSRASKGIYFLELSNGNDKAVKKIQLN